MRHEVADVEKHREGDQRQPISPRENKVEERAVPFGTEMRMMRRVVPWEVDRICAAEATEVCRNPLEDVADRAPGRRNDPVGGPLVERNLYQGIGHPPAYRPDAERAEHDEGPPIAASRRQEKAREP